MYGMYGYPGVYGNAWAQPVKQVKKPSEAFDTKGIGFDFNGEKLILTDGTVVGTLPFKLIKNTVYDSTDKKIGRIQDKRVLLDYGNTYFVAGNIDKRGVIRIKDKVCNPTTYSSSSNEKILTEILTEVQNVHKNLNDFIEDFFEVIDDLDFPYDDYDEEMIVIELPDLISNTEYLTETVGGKFIPTELKDMLTE